ncbi:DNA-binding SARP family transcriptional activator [Kribbella antiqua]|uniref:DNA-binding SARP family transcriptional activator n=1 Tax=Kribbella antiqua TaxID=2512217 RepID=A0A4R2IG75_9ACTN|nr:AfsR/SARP family transcriptional regulator [Kribbella antiqua]TCO43724.1 DNA-binding SARP family transcriptional activator [Kribbella antiqua]
MNGHSALPSVRNAAQPCGGLAFRVLGPLEVDGPDGRPLDVCGGKPATVLTLLVLHRNAWVSTEQLIDAVWAGRDIPASAQNNLKTYVWQLRRALPDERIESRPGAYRVRVLPGELDADVAAGLCDEARSLLTDGSPLEAVAVVERALSLWRGCPYDGLTVDATSAVDRLTELHRTLREDLADAQLALGRPAAAIAVLRSLTEEEPLRELAWARLMAAYRQTGRRHDALAAYQRARTALVRDLGIEPGAELTALHQEILSEEAPKLVPPPLSSNLPPRIPGFVGRAHELRTLQGATGVVTIDGMPGIGKTAFALEVAAASGHETQHYVDVSSSVQLPPATGLLILDNVDHADQVRRLLPNNPDALVLLISRHRLTGLDRSGAITLDVLASDEAERLTDIDQVLRWCEGHPGAIRHLVERMRNRKPWTVRRMAAQLDDPAARCRALADVLAPFDVAYDGLPGPVQRFYRRIGATPQFDLGRAARLAGMSQQEVEPMVDLLMDLNLVAEPAPGRFALLPVARDHARQLLLATESKAELVA